MGESMNCSGASTCRKRDWKSMADVGSGFPDRFRQEKFCQSRDRLCQDAYGPDMYSQERLCSDKFAILASASLQNDASLQERLQAVAIQQQLQAKLQAATGGVFVCKRRKSSLQKTQRPASVDGYTLGKHARSPFLAPASRKRKRQIAETDTKQKLTCADCGHVRSTPHCAGEVRTKISRRVADIVGVIWRLCPRVHVLRCCRFSSCVL